MRWIYNDGGRAEAGFKGITDDCCCRAFAIATQRPYREVYDLINEIGKANKKHADNRSTARTGVYSDDAKKVAEALGMKWVATMKIGQGCKVHLRENELPSGRIVCSVSKHYTAVVDGVINDLFDPRRDGTRCVYGYWVAE